MSDRVLLVLDELDQFIKVNKLHTYALNSEWCIDLGDLQNKLDEIRTRMAASQPSSKQESKWLYDFLYFHDKRQSILYDEIVDDLDEEEAEIFRNWFRKLMNQLKTDLEKKDGN
jgi:hypothetical protein